MFGWFDCFYVYGLDGVCVVCWWVDFVFCVFGFGVGVYCIVFVFELVDCYFV